MLVLGTQHGPGLRRVGRNERRRTSRAEAPQRPDEGPQRSLTEPGLTLAAPTVSGPRACVGASWRSRARRSRARRVATQTRGDRERGEAGRGGSPPKLVGIAGPGEPGAAGGPRKTGGTRG